jgi:hypothetical protein
MKILLAGDWLFDVYESACANALRKLGVEIIPFIWSQYFTSFLGKLERKYIMPGPCTQKLQQDLIQAVNREHPDVILIWRGTHMLPQTLQKMRLMNTTVIVSRNNDNPFSPSYQYSKSLHHRRLWKFFHSTIPFYDLHLAYRQRNIEDYYAAGAHRVELLRSYYIPEIHRPISLSDEEDDRFACDVVFIGHYEADRLKYLNALVQARLKVRLYGPSKSWTSERLNHLATYFGNIHPVFGNEYAKAIAGAKMGLCCFSKLNRDSYTRRVFEITAAECMLLSERTAEMLSLFDENEEAVYFSDSDELVNKVNALLKQPKKIQEIAKAGRQRCLSDGHDVVSRMQKLLDILRDLIK